MLINRCYYPETRKAIDHYSYALNEEIGRGFSSKVYRGRDENSQMTVAVKVIDMKMVKQSIHATLLKNEINALKSFNSKNILKLYDVFQTQNNTYIITEYCDSGDLSGVIKKRGRIDEPEALRIMNEIITGLLEINQKGYIHRDIKPANILIEKQTPKIADFGFAVQINSMEVKQQGRHYNVGTPLYMSPQALRQQGHTEKGDVWAMGVMFFEMLFGQTPYTAQTEQGLLTAILHHHLIIPSHPSISDASKDFIRRCLCIDENQRMRVKDMSTHAIYSQFSQPVYKPIPLQTQQSSNIPTPATRTPIINKDRSQSQGIRDFQSRPKCQTQIHNDSKVSKRCPSEMYHLPHPPTTVIEPPTSDPMRSKSQKQITESRKTITQENQFEKRSFKKNNTVLQERSLNVQTQPSQNTTPVQSPIKFKSNNDILFAQINYCRFLYKFSQQIINSRQITLSNGLKEKLLFLMAKNIAMKISKLHTIIDKENSKDNTFQLEDFDVYRKAESFQKFSQAIAEYNENYKRYFDKTYQMIVNKNLPQDKKFEALFDKDLSEFESFYFITQSYLRQALQELKGELPNSNSDPDAFLPEEFNFNYFVSQQLCNYLLICHCTLQHMNDYKKFSKILKIDQMVDQKQNRCTYRQVEDLRNKIQELVSK
ncbi:unnamed protein product [Paramecium sonneborni]|uniref:Protein kinase domain-containing protein n=1 Tax=Paramecium sonneborni TaxID=65129 RepID=A0A8S1ME83_9CILI|nr:unnamed protein product [Paramecium sonneborni]